MSATLTETDELVRQFIEQYFEAWSGTDEEAILAYYSDDVTLLLPTGFLDGKASVCERFVRPFCSAFPGNVHHIQNLVCSEGLVAVEWVFRAVHRGVFQGVHPTQSKVQVPGCSFYVLQGDFITGGRIYFNMPTLLDQIGVRS